MKACEQVGIIWGKESVKICTKIIQQMLHGVTCVSQFSLPDL
jgi:hypothetical protein